MPQKSADAKIENARFVAAGENAESVDRGVGTWATRQHRGRADGLSAGWRNEKAVEGHRSPGRWRVADDSGAKRPGLRQPSGALGAVREKRETAGKVVRGLRVPVARRKQAPAGRHLCSCPTKMNSSSVRSGICRPTGLGNLGAWVATKISLLTELRFEDGTERRTKRISPAGHATL